MFEKLTDKLNIFHDFGSRIAYKTIDVGSRVAAWCMNAYFTIATPLYNRVLRTMTRPFNKWWIKLWEDMQKKGEAEYLDIPGMHLITALQGGGKSSLMFHKSVEYRYRMGKGMYVNTHFEKPYYDDIGGFEYVYNKYFENDEFFRDGKLRKRPNYKLFCGFIFDEEAKFNNHRLNKQKSYNNTFLGRQDLCVGMRHLKCPYILIASQLDKIDNQALGLIKYMHEVEIDKGVNYQKWLRDGIFETTILGWNITTYKFSRTNGYYNKYEIGKWYKPCTVSMSNFETFGLAEEYDKLDMDMEKERMRWAYDTRESA